MPGKQASPTLVSLVIPVYNEEAIIATTLKNVGRSLSNTDVAVEMVIVDDGSTDNSWAQLLKLQEGNRQLKLIRLSRNFGKESAIMAGIDHCTGDAVIILDGDLQHPPELLNQMIETWRSGDVDIIDGVKTDQRGETLANRITSRLFHVLFSLLTGHDLSGASDYKLLSRKAVDALLKLKDGHLFFRGMSHWLGFKRTQIAFQVSERSQGKSKWGFLARMRLAINAITSQTAIPLHLVTLVGLISLLFAVLMGLQTLYMYFRGVAVEGFTTVILLVLFFGSMTLLGLGIIGAYLSRIYDEVRGRPRYLVQEIVQAEQHNTSKNYV